MKKKNNNKTHDKKQDSAEVQETQVTSETPAGARRANVITGMIVAFFVFVSFYIRGIIPWERGSQLVAEGLTFAMDDAVFHMRLVENTLAHFPERIFYDAFTRYPYGNQLHWGALFDQTIAGIAIVAGWIFDGGVPSALTINTVGSFYPVVLGALCVIPAYYIGRELAGRKAGIIAAALTALLPGQFLSRSVLGFTDNHIAEVLFLTLSVMYFVMALKRSEPLTFDNIKNKNITVMKPGIYSSIMAGVFLGIYLLNWTSGIFFVVVFGIFIGIQFLGDHLRAKKTEYLVVISAPLFIIPLLMIAPYVQGGYDSAYYSMLHVVVILIALISAVTFHLISKKVSDKKLNPLIYLLIMGIIIGVSAFILQFIMPELYSVTLGNLSSIFSEKTGGNTTIAEARTLDTATAIILFGENYYLSYLGLALVIFMSQIKNKAEHTLIAVWSIFILLIMLAQIRFSYYYAINIAILTSVIAAYTLDYVGWKNFNLNTVKGAMNELKPFPLIVLGMFIMIMIFYPMDASIYKTSTSTTKSGALSAGYFEWNYALTWMKNNTPDPGVDYYGIYERPPKGERYPYPDTAYGVMSWWDYGHVISFWGHRIPNANPFQAGIGGGDEHTPGASTFLSAQSEEEGNRIMDELGSRYVITDAFMAYGIQPVFAKWNNQNDIADAGFSGTTHFSPKDYYITAVRTNNGVQTIPGLKMYTSMTGKLHIFDTDGMQRYRLVHETIPSPASLNAKVGEGMQIEENYKSVSNLVYGYHIITRATGYVKIFEYVKGGKVTGSAPANTSISLSLGIKTNIGREFNYTQKTTSDINGSYMLIVPYSTKGWETGETTLDVRPTGAYTISANGTSREFDVYESDIMSGGTITTDLT